MEKRVLVALKKSGPTVELIDIFHETYTDWVSKALIQISARPAPGHGETLLVGSIDAAVSAVDLKSLRHNVEFLLEARESSGDEFEIEVSYQGQIVCSLPVDVVVTRTGRMDGVIDHQDEDLGDEVTDGPVGSDSIEVDPPTEDGRETVLSKMME